MINFIIRTLLFLTISAGSFHELPRVNIVSFSPVKSVTEINETIEIVDKTVATSRLPLWVWVLGSCTFIVIVMGLSANIMLNGLKFGEKFVIKGFRQENSESRDDIFTIGLMRDKMVETRKSFESTMINKIRAIDIYKKGTCNDHLRALELLLVEELYDFINDNHVEKKANYMLPETQRLLVKMKENIRNRWNKSVEKHVNCGYYELSYGNYEAIVADELDRFYEDFQREVDKMLTRKIEILKNFSGKIKNKETEKRMITEPLDKFKRIRKMIHRSYITNPAVSNRNTPVSITPLLISNTDEDEDEDNAHVDDDDYYETSFMK